MIDLMSLTKNQFRPLHFFLNNIFTLGKMLASLSQSCIIVLHLFSEEEQQQLIS